MNRSVNSFYNSKGWEIDKDGNFFDAVSFEDLRKNSQNYLKENRLSLMKYFPKYGDIILDCASGPIQYIEYLKYSENYKKRVCIDFSLEALKIAKSRDPKKIEIINGDILKINIDNYKYSTILCIHTLYHLKKTNQIKVIKKFIKAIKVDGTIIILYSNPQFLLERIKNVLKIFNQKKPEFIFERFTPSQIKEKFPKAEFFPFRCLSGEDMKRLLPDNFSAKIILSFLKKIESYLPLFFVQYYVIRLKN